MRAVVAIMLIFAAIVFVSTAMSTNCIFPRFFKHRTKLREIRGFKPEYISTAIGFGKRRDHPVEAQDYGDREGIPHPLLLPRYFLRGVPAEVLLQVMQTDPAFADELVRLSMQNVNRGDEESMMDRSKSARMHTLF